MLARCSHSKQSALAPLCQFCGNNRSDQHEFSAWRNIRVLAEPYLGAFTTGLTRLTQPLRRCALLLIASVLAGTFFREKKLNQFFALGRRKDNFDLSRCGGGSGGGGCKSAVLCPHSSGVQLVLGLHSSSIASFIPIVRIFRRRCNEWLPDTMMIRCRWAHSIDANRLNCQIISFTAGSSLFARQGQLHTALLELSNTLLH